MITAFKVGKAYLIKEDSKETIYHYFSDVSRTTKRLVLTRDPPQTIKGYFSNHDTEFLWLTNSMDHDCCIRPQEMEQLSYTIEMFIKNNKKSSILIIGLEFIISYTSFDQTIHLIQSIRDLSLTNDCTLFVIIGETTMDLREQSLLEQELELLKIK